MSENEKDLPERFLQNVNITIIVTMDPCKKEGNYPYINLKPVFAACQEGIHESCRLKFQKDMLFI